MSLVHNNFKVWYTYKGVLCQYLDGVNYNFDKNLTLGATLERCRAKNPNSIVWYEVVNVRPYNAPSGKVYRNCRCLCDIRVIYSPKKLGEYGKVDKTIKPKVTLLTVRKDDGDIIRIGKYTLKKLTDGKYAVDKSAFVGTLEECEKYVEYVRQAPECYRIRATKCANWNEFVMRTDFGGKCVCTTYKVEKNHKYDLNFRYKMHKGSAYLTY